MQNYVQRGENLKLTAPAGGVVSGTAYLIGGLLVAALFDADEGDEFTGVSEGVVDLPKENTTAAFSEGDIAYWDDGNARFDESAVGRYPAATVVAAAIATDAVVRVKLHGRATVAVV